jgi:hypothetical protein
MKNKQKESCEKGGRSKRVQSELYSSTGGVQRPKKTKSTKPTKQKKK